MEGKQPQHKLGLISIICLLVGAVVVLAFIVLKGNKILMLSDSNSVKYNNKSFKKDTNKSKRYLVINNYYQKNSNKSYQTRQYTDTLPYNLTANSYEKYTPKQNGIIFDINYADTLDLQMLRGIGPTFARRICKYRDKLGGFVRLNQLKEVYGMTDTLYNSIIKQLKITAFEPKKININSVNIKELTKHPYIDYYLAKRIIEFHNSYGEFKNVYDLKKVYLMDETTFKRIKPYVGLN